MSIRKLLGGTFCLVLGLTAADASAVLELGDIITSDSNGEIIWLVKPDTGNRVILSSDSTAFNVGAGPNFEQIDDLAISPSGDIYALSDFNNTLFRVDPGNGNRTIVSQFGDGKGPDWSPDAMTIDGNGRIFAFDTWNGVGITEVDPVTGNRTKLTLTGNVPFSANGLTVDRNGDFFITNNTSITKVDGTTGIGSVFSAQNDGKGANFSQGRDIDILPGGDFILSDNQSSASVMRVNQVTGQRTILAGFFGGGHGAAVEPTGTIAVAERNRLRLQRLTTGGAANIFSDNSGIGTGPGFGLLEQVAVYGGSNYGLAQDFALLPNADDAPNTDGDFDFAGVPGDGRWFDPIMATGYDYQTNDGSLFTKIIMPLGIDGDGLFVLIDPVNGNTVLTQGVMHSFATPVAFFGITGIDPAVDGTDPLAFPTFLEFDTDFADFTMTPTPEPTSLALIGLGGLALTRRRR